MNRWSLSCYAATIVVLLLPLLVIGGIVGAIINDNEESAFNIPSSCTHINCIFLLSDVSRNSLLLVLAGAAISGIYIIAATVNMNSKKDSELHQEMPLLLGYYALYLQSLRVILFFTFFEYAPPLWTTIFSRIAIFALTFHAAIFFVGSLWMVARQTEYKITFIIFAFLVSFSVAYLIPVDQYFLTPQLLHTTGYFEQLRIFLFIMNTITIINYLKYYTETRKKEVWLLHSAFLLQTFSLHATLFSISTWLLIGALAGLICALLCNMRYIYPPKRSRA